MNRATPTVRSERGLSQTAARMLARSAEPPQRRGLAERCELGQLALRRQGPFKGAMRETLGEISPCVLSNSSIKTVALKV